MRRCDVLIAGGGIGGASLGCLLATQTDLDVALLEASERLGGRARSGPFAGAEIDCGLHALPTLALAPTVSSPGLVGPGRSLVSIFSPLGTTPSVRGSVEAAADSLVELYEPILPGLERRTVDRQVRILPVTGAEATVRSNFLDRPQVQCSRPRNLLFAGDWVQVRGVGGERAFASALECLRNLRD